MKNVQIIIWNVVKILKDAEFFSFSLFHLFCYYCFKCAMLQSECYIISHFLQTNLKTLTFSKSSLAFGHFVRLLLLTSFQWNFCYYFCTNYYQFSIN